jgi:AbrB family looped-hinge helix DNA binding protein
MRTTIDRAGRVVIPKEIREKAGLKPGMSLDIRIDNGVVEIEPEPVPMRLERRGRFVVLVPEVEIPLLTVEDVNRAIDETRLERERQILGIEE